MRTWLDVAKAFAADRGVETYVHVLEAFVGPHPRGGPPPPEEIAWAGDFDALERHRLADDLSAISTDLQEEVDEAQACMFERRLRSVDLALHELGDDAGRLLRVGLRQRLQGILAAPRPRALRVRALADFYYSYAGWHRHQRAAIDPPSVASLVAAARWERVGAGVDYALLSGPSECGPLHVNLLRVDPSRVRFVVRDCRERAHAGEPFETLVHEHGAIAAVSGGFFLYSEPDIAPPSARHDPVGLLLDDAVVLSPPVFRRGGLFVDERGQVSIGRVGMADVDLRGPDGTSWPTDAIVNRATAADAIGPDVASAAIVGTQIVACGRSLPVPLNGFVVPLPNGAAMPEIGAPVRFAAVRGPTGPLVTGIAGGPMLLDGDAPCPQMRAEDFWGTAPPVTFSQDETGDHNRLPRLAVGQRDDGQLVFAAVDGRNFEHALGMTLAEVGALLRTLGCTRATNLDGGSSKRMVVDGRTRDLPTTEIVAGVAEDAPVRPVYTALLICQ